MGSYTFQEIPAIIQETSFRFCSLPPATKLRQGYIFTGVCHSVNRGGVCSGGYLLLGGCLLRGGGWWGCRGGVSAPGVCLVETPPGRPLLRAVRILLECILVVNAPLESCYQENGSKTAVSLYYRYLRRCWRRGSGDTMAPSRSSTRFSTTSFSCTTWRRSSASTASTRPRSGSERRCFCCGTRLTIRCSAGWAINSTSPTPR